MVLAHDTVEALEFAAVLVNTADRVPDALTTVADLEALLSENWTGSRTRDQAEVEAMRRLRPQLRSLWTAPEAEAVRMVNDLLRRHRAQPQLVRHDGWDWWHLHAVPSEAPLQTRAAVEAAMAMIDVIRADELDRLRVCEGEDCRDLVLDLSRNRSRRYCEGGCGARAHSAAYRARKHRGQAAGSSRATGRS